MNNMKTIILLCFIYFIATVHTIDNLEVEMETDTPEADELEINKLKIDTSEIDEIEKWSNSLKPAKILRWHLLFPNLSGFYYRDYLKKVLALTRCPTHIVNDLAEKYIEIHWPIGISTDTALFKNMSLMESYNFRRLPDTTISKEVVVVLTSDNKTMPEDMIDELGFVMFFGKGGTADTEDNDVEMATDTSDITEIDELKIVTSEIDEIKIWSNSLQPAKVVDWGRLYTNLSGYYYKDYLRKVLALAQCPTDIINDLSDKYTENNWPPGILTYLERKFSKTIMDSYICRRLPGTSISKEVVVVLASDNKTMPEDMIDEMGFVMILNKAGTRAREDITFEMATDTLKVNELIIDSLNINISGIDETIHFRNDVINEIDTSDLSDIKKWSNSLKPAKVVWWGSLYTSFSCRERTTSESLVNGGCPIHIVNGLAEKYNGSHWPPGLLTQLDMLKVYGMFNLELLNSYNCRRLPSTTVDKEVVIVLASDNETMPKEMIDEIGFIMFFDEGDTADIKDIV